MSIDVIDYKDMEYLFNEVINIEISMLSGGATAVQDIDYCGIRNNLFGLMFCELRKKTKGINRGILINEHILLDCVKHKDFQTQAYTVFSDGMIAGCVLAFLLKLELNGRSPKLSLATSMANLYCRKKKRSIDAAWKRSKNVVHYYAALVYYMCVCFPESDEISWIDKSVDCNIASRFSEHFSRLAVAYIYWGNKFCEYLITWKSKQRNTSDNAVHRESVLRPTERAVMLMGRLAAIADDVDKCSWPLTEEELAVINKQ